MLGELPVRGVIVTSRSDQPGFDFVSRFFAPASGVNEDPATGSAHCTLGPFWQERLNKSEFTAYQASARGGVLKVRVADDRVFLGGQAVTGLLGGLVLAALDSFRLRHPNSSIRFETCFANTPMRPARVNAFKVLPR